MSDLRMFYQEPRGDLCLSLSAVWPDSDGLQSATALIPVALRRVIKCLRHALTLPGTGPAVLDGLN
jgi:hypothetical protein